MPWFGLLCTSYLLCNGVVLMCMMAWHSNLVCVLFGGRTERVNAGHLYSSSIWMIDTCDRLSSRIQSRFWPQSCMQASSNVIHIMATIMVGKALLQTWRTCFWWISVNYLSLFTRRILVIIIDTKAITYIASTSHLITKPNWFWYSSL